MVHKYSVLCWHHQQNTMRVHIFRYKYLHIHRTPPPWCGCGPGHWECHPVALSSSERFLSRSGAGPVLWAGHWGSGRQPSTVSRTRREGEPDPASAECGLVWLSEVRRQEETRILQVTTTHRRAEQHASWDTVWKTQGQGEAEGGGQGEQDTHRGGQIWHEGCLGNVSTSHQDLINTIVMAANRVLAGAWQHINTCTAAKSVINMHIWTRANHCNSPADCHFAERYWCPSS